MYGASTSGRGAQPAAGTSGGSLADDGPVGVDGRRDGFAARGGAAGASSAAPTGHGGHGDGSIFSTSSGLYQVAKSRTGSSYAGSAHGGSQSGRNGERHSDAARQPRVAYYGDAPRRAESMASDEHRGSHHSDERGAHGRRSSETRARESGDDQTADDATIPKDPSDSKKQSRSSARSDSAKSDPKQWVRVDDLMRTSLKAETALGKIAEATSAAAQRESPRKQGGARRVDNATQTLVAGMVEPANLRAQLSFQASLQTELRETQELLIETQMRVKELVSDKRRLVEDLEEATRARVGARERKERDGKTERDEDDVPDDAMTPTQEEMDETVHSLLEMITAERDKAGALETHLERLTTELDLEREARLNAQSALAESDAATEEDFSAQERKLREATEIIGELRRALLSVMQVREGSVFGGSAREGGSHRGPGSDGGSSRRSAGGRSPRGTPARAANADDRTRPTQTIASDVSLYERSERFQPSRDVSVRPLSSAALARAREEARRRTEEAVRRWERRLEERVDAVVARAVDRACEESLGSSRGTSAVPRADDPVLLAVGGSVRAALREAVEAHAATLVDDLRDAASEDDDARFLDVDSAYAYAETTEGEGPSEGKTKSLPPGSREKLTCFLAEEAARRARLRETVAHLREQLREKEAEARRVSEKKFRAETRVSRANESESTSSVAAVASLAATEAAATCTQNENEKAPDAGLGTLTPSFRDLDLYDAARGAVLAARRVANTPAFELAWPLLLVAALLRAQIGPDAFAWSSVF